MAATKHAQTIKNDTKDFITAALLQLLSKRKLQTLTVSMVCKRAGVSRMAFYRHYDGLEQILHEYYQPKIAEVFDVIHKETNDFTKFNVQLEFFNAFGDELLLSLEQGFETIIEKIFIAEIEKFYTPKLDEYRIAFISAGVYALWRKWLINGKTIPLNEVTKFLKTLSTEVL